MRKLFEKHFWLSVLLMMVSLYAQMFIELPNKKANISFDPLQCIPFSLKGAQSFITQQHRKCVACLSSKTFSLFFAFALYTPNRYLRERTKKCTTGSRIRLSFATTPNQNHIRTIRIMLTLSQIKYNAQYI